MMKMNLFVLLLISYQWTAINCQLNLYDADPMSDDDWFQFDCLHYYLSTKELAYQDSPNVMDHFIPYCIRPINRTHIAFEDVVNRHGQHLSFIELRLANITAEQLLWWSASINVAERYQFYLNELKSSLDEIFYNCTQPWFGSRCQYSFELTDSMSMDSIVEATFSQRRAYNETSDTVTQLPCYIHISCDRGGLSLCLDWREVCDGRVDCLDGGLDEAFCFDMEVNECGEDEYRCHNGLCISEEFWEGGLGTADCLDRSDESRSVKYPESCFQDPTFRCEEHMCKTNGFEFACGDGQCVEKGDQCHNGRHVALLESLTAQGNLSDKCWIAMSCLTMLVKQINGTPCETWLMNNATIEFLQSCQSLLQFPTIPVHLGHIRFFYENHRLRLNMSLFWIPDYVCYDEQQCHLLTPAVSNLNLTCLSGNDMRSRLEGAEMLSQPWVDVFSSIHILFRPCFISPTILNNKSELTNHSSLYQCRNSSKLISKNRILDRYRDCYLNDDEFYKDSCSLKNKYRVKCPMENVCLSASLSINDCSIPIDRYEKKIPLQMICNGFEELKFKDSNGQIYTDESECLDSSCVNLYTQCDGFWACEDGRDEVNCTQSKCPVGTHPCVSPETLTLICLPSAQFTDKQDDCLGGSDQYKICRARYPTTSDPLRFRCLNTAQCLSSSELCNHVSKCPEGDDEKLCQNNRPICHEDFMKNRTDEEDVLCRLGENDANRIRYFSLISSPFYPLEQRPQIPWIQEQGPIENDQIVKTESNLWPWNCNRGLEFRISSSNMTSNFQCFCPPSYYGHLCQYQSQRVSITLRLLGDIHHGAYTLLMMLIDDNDQGREIHSFDQLVFVTGQSCNVKFNRYLLYYRRPKDNSENYSVRIDVFSKSSLAYYGSWYFPISFPFLPVNRLAVVLRMASSPVSASSVCTTACKHGQCMRYINDKKYFCRCSPGWSGIECDKEIDCGHCSPDSICVGQVKNRSICICPLTKFGPRCLLQSSCPKNACQNGGQCVPAHETEHQTGYSCICPSNYYGIVCQNLKGKLEVSLNDITIPPYVLAFIFTTSNESEPRSTLMLQKLTLFQHIVVFRISTPFHLVYLKANQNYYLAVVQQSATMDISTSISPKRQCIPSEKFFNPTIKIMNQLQRMKFYHIPCQQNLNLICFVDEVYLCLCTNDHHANCLNFDRDQNLECSSKHSCANGAKCLQDHPTCPSSIICVCQDCFFGNRCQYYAKGFGFTLDQILGYEIKRNTRLSQQGYSVRVSAIITMIMFGIGVINGILSIITFRNKNTQKVGCGKYLLASSITSLLVVILFTLKFWFLILSQMDLSGHRIILYVNCMLIEPLLKALLYMDNWLNSCTAFERSLAVFQGITFNKTESKQFANWVITYLIIAILVLFMPQLSQIHLFDDEKEERSWCVIHYSPLLEKYNSILILFHVLIPFVINLFSSIYIIFATARRRDNAQDVHSYWINFILKFQQYKHLLISAILLVILAMPHLVLSFVLDCNKSSRHYYLFLSAYFISFAPSTLVFVVFVLPSKLYRVELQNALKQMRRRHTVLQLIFSVKASK